MIYRFNPFTGNLDLVDVARIELGGPVTGGTVGSVLFIGTGSVLQEDNANFSYNDATNALTVSGMTFDAGSITDATGAISFGNENLTTSGTLASFAHTISTLQSGNQLVLTVESITNTSGAISFGNENLTTTGTLASAAHTIEDATNVCLTLDVLTGTQDLLQFKDNGTNVFKMNDEGFTALGPGSVFSSSAYFNLGFTYSNSGTFNFGMISFINQDTASTLGPVGIGSTASTSHTSGSVVFAEGYFGGVSVASDSTLFVAIGVNGDSSVTGTNTPAVIQLVGVKGTCDAEDGAITTAASIWGIDPDVDGGSITTSYAGVFEGDVCVTSNNKLLLEGSFAVKGDSYFLFDSVGATIDCFVNATEVWNATSSTITMVVDVTMTDAQNIILNATTGTQFGTATTQKLAFYGTTAIVQPTEITDELTSITHTAPGTPDFAIQDLVDSGVGSAFGFATKDEGNTVLSVILNLQSRVNELENTLSSLGLLADAD